MSRRTIVIDFGESVDPRLLHRIGNLQCELSGEFLKSGKAVVDDHDRILPQVRVSVQATRHIGNVMATIDTFLKRHNLYDLACIRR